MWECANHPHLRLRTKLNTINTCTRLESASPWLYKPSFSRFRCWSLTNRELHRLYYEYDYETRYLDTLASRLDGLIFEQNKKCSHYSVLYKLQTQKRTLNHGN